MTPLDRVGIYVPGGKAAYPSTVLMNAMPARVAGVREIVMVVPTPDGERSDLVLAAAAICGVDRVFTIGGAQAVGALAYGTESVPQVDKIVGPGNAYVAAAKRRVFGVVGIDMVAGPSEILVLCDGRTNPDWVAMDLFSQAEHDEMAQAILLCPDAGIHRCGGGQHRAAAGRDAAQGGDRGVAGGARRADQGAGTWTKPARSPTASRPSIWSLSVEDAEAWLPKIRHAGAMFVGKYSSEALGDYCAGPNHVLPTARTARFSSPLGVYDFPEAHQRHPGLARRRAQARHHRRRAGDGRRPARACPDRRGIVCMDKIGNMDKTPQSVIPRRDARALGLPRPRQPRAW